MTECIAYMGGYKYQLAETYVTFVAVYPSDDICTEYIDLSKGGRLEVRKGYAWDGPSGPAFDTPSFMRAALVHDASYQLMRLDLLPAVTREAIDDEMRRMCLEDGMWRIRAWWCWRGVRRFAAGAASEPARKRSYTLHGAAETLRMNTLDKLISLRHACEKAVNSVDGARMVGSVTDHERETTEFGADYDGQYFVIALRESKRQLKGE